MKLGFNLPQIGPAASPEAMIRVAQRTEELGYDSVWVTDRVLFPIDPQTPYMGTPDGSLPDVYKSLRPTGVAHIRGRTHKPRQPGHQHPGHALL